MVIFESKSGIIKHYRYIVSRYLKSVKSRNLGFHLCIPKNKDSFEKYPKPTSNHRKTTILTDTSLRSCYLQKICMEQEGEEKKMRMICIIPTWHIRYMLHIHLQERNVLELTCALQLYNHSYKTLHY